MTYVLEVAERGVRGAVDHDPALLGGLTTLRGELTNRAVAEALGLPATDPVSAVAGN